MNLNLSTLRFDRRRVHAACLGAAFALSAALAATSASAHDPARGHGAWAGKPSMNSWDGSPERINRRVDRMLDGLDATDSQRLQIKQIVQAAADDLRLQQEAGRGLHGQAALIFSAPVVDANAAEQLRQQMVSYHDQRSRRITAALIDASRVLTPEQRVKVVERMNRQPSSRPGEPASAPMLR